MSHFSCMSTRPRELFRKLHIREVFLGGCSTVGYLQIGLNPKVTMLDWKDYSSVMEQKIGIITWMFVCLCIRIHVRVFVCWAVLSRGSQWKRWQLCAPVRLWCWRFVGCSLSLIPNTVICGLQSCCKERHSWKLCSSLSTCTVGGAEKCLLL